MLWCGGVCSGVLWCVVVCCDVGVVCCGVCGVACCGVGVVCCGVRVVAWCGVVWCDVERQSAGVTREL